MKQVITILLLALASGWAYAIECPDDIDQSYPGEAVSIRNEDGTIIVVLRAQRTAGQALVTTHTCLTEQSTALLLFQLHYMEGTTQRHLVPLEVEWRLSRQEVLGKKLQVGRRQMRYVSKEEFQELQYRLHPQKEQ